MNLKLRKPLYTSEDTGKWVIKNKTNNEKEKKEDVINNPSHYTMHDIEPLDVIENWQLGFHLGNCIKYIARCEYKGTKIQDNIAVKLSFRLDLGL